MDDFFDAFDIPEQKIVEQTEDWLTDANGNGKIDKKPEEVWDPLA